MINGITLYRLLSAPVLIFLIIYGKLELFSWLLALSFSTDYIDGFLARWYNVTSIWGSRLDSLADDLTVAAATVGLIVFKTDFIRQEKYWFIGLFILFFVQVFLAVRRYGKTTSFHTYGAKAAALAQGIFLVLIFFLPQPPMFLFYLACGVTGAELVEEIILTFLLPEWQANVKGIYWVLRRN